MSWRVERWVWRLESPLYIGALPAGSLNRCRLYVPARAMHGALAAFLAREKALQAKSTPDYGKIGHELGFNCRFTYFYPAEEIDGDYHPWLPRFEEGKGLCWKRNCSKGPEPDRTFRQHIVDTRPGVSITPLTDSAADGELWETEYMSQWWREAGSATLRPVYLVGYVFRSGNAYNRYFECCETLFLGGDTRYGMGKVRRVERRELTDNYVFDATLKSLENNPVLLANHILGHEKILAQGIEQERTGAKDMAMGWNIHALSEGVPSWVPGSDAQKTRQWTINRYGFWECVGTVTAREQSD